MIAKRKEKKNLSRFDWKQLYTIILLLNFWVYLKTLTRKKKEEERQEMGEGADSP